MSDSLRPHESQHARPPCPSPAPGVHSDSSPLSQWCHPAISSSGRPLLLLPPIPPSIRVFSNESALRMRWPKYWSFSFSIMPSKEIPGLISYFFLNIRKYCFHKIFYFREYIFFINCKYFQRMLLYLQQQVNPMTLRLNKVGVYFLISVGGALLCAIMQSPKLTEAQPSSLWSSQIHLTLSSCWIGEDSQDCMGDTQWIRCKPLPSHFIGQNSGTWLLPTSREAGLWNIQADCHSSVSQLKTKV